MDYFVSAENTAYYHWQLELLIESFKRNNCEDNLFIALTNDKQFVKKRYLNNIYKHKNKIFHENVGPLNQINSLCWAIRNKKIKQPFAIIPPHVVLRNPTNLNFSPYPEIITSPHPEFTEQTAKDHGLTQKYIPFGNISIFSNIPELIFEKIAFSIKKQNIWAHMDKLALTEIFSEFILKIRIRIETLSETMLEGGNSYFIDYEYGMPPVFNKSMFAYEPPGYISYGDPFETLGRNFPTPNSLYISELTNV